MTIIVNNNSTASIRNSLSKNLAEAKKESLRTATGDKILASYEDPSSYVLGHKLKADSEILSINNTSAVQTAAMINQANTRIADLKNQAKAIKSNLLQGYNIFVSDEVRINHLQPIHHNFVNETDRLVTEFNFAGQKLFTGGMGTQTGVVASTLVTELTNLDSATITLNGVATITGVEFNGSADTITLNNGRALPINITGGARVNNTDGSITITGASASLNNISVDFTDGSNYNSDVNLSNISVTLNSTGTQIISLTVGNIDLPDISGLNTTNATFTLSTSNADVTGATVVQSLKGGSIGSSNLKLITGVKLDQDSVDIKLPNLTTSDVMQSLNIENYKGTTPPTGFVPITNRESVEYNMQLIDAYISVLNVAEGELAATAVTLENIISSNGASLTALTESIDVVLSNDFTASLTNKTVKEFNAYMGMKMFGDALESIRTLKQIVN
jgi:flagellin-like hook-associated protein FlgL